MCSHLTEAPQEGVPSFPLLHWYAIAPFKALGMVIRDCPILSDRYVTARYVRESLRVSLVGSVLKQLGGDRIASTTHPLNEEELWRL